MKYYLPFLTFIIMPANGYLMYEHFILGFILGLCQMPVYFFNYLNVEG